MLKILNNLADKPELLGLVSCFSGYPVTHTSDEIIHRLLTAVYPEITRAVIPES